MYFDDAEGLVFRPPSEANSFILRVTIGCSHNACTFCAMYKDVKFRIRSFEEVCFVIDRVSSQMPNLRRVFLADGNALMLPTNYLLQIMQKLRLAFPKLTRINSYGSTKDLLQKSPDELILLKNAGLQTIYLGIESGDDKVLEATCKGITAAQIIDSGKKVLAAGLKLSAMVILGLGGKDNSNTHAALTAQVINAINPTMLSALTLMLYQNTSLYTITKLGQFKPLSVYEALEELRQLIDQLHLKNQCLFRCNHVSNSLLLSGLLPKDKESFLQELNTALVYYKHNPLPMPVTEEYL